MSIDSGTPTAPPACPEFPPPGDLLTARIADVRGWLGGLDATDLTDPDRIRVVTALEELTAAAAGTQARMTAAYADSQRALGCSVRGVAAEVGLARRVGLSRAARLVSAARVLVDDLPETLEHLETGRLSEVRAVQVAGQVTDLDPAERAEVDALVAEDLPRLGDAEVRDAVDAAIIGIDPDAVEARRRAACLRRRVTVRPGEDGMAWLSIHTTAVEAAAALNTLRAHADSVLAGSGGLGDLREDPEGRTHAEVMVDGALSRLTGRTVHEGPPVEIQLVMTDTALLQPPGTRPASPNRSGAPIAPTAKAGAADPSGTASAVARVVGVGPVPVGIVRDLIRHTPVAGADRNATRAGAGASRLDTRPVSGAGTGSGPFRMFEGPDWVLDERTPEQWTRDVAEDRARWRRDDREAVRVTLRRVHVSPDGRNPVAIDARRRRMPAAARDPDRRDDPAVREWFARLRVPAHPDELASLTSPQRCARGLLRLLVILRDQRCRVPWCTAPIRHLDHVQPHRDGGVTTLTGLSGDCIGHNLAKEDPGHTVTVTRDGLVHSAPDGIDHPHTIRWTTPTGLVQDGVAPPVLGWGTSTGSADEIDEPAAASCPDLSSPLEQHLAAMLVA